VSAQNVLLVATWGAGMFRSLDSGLTWFPCDAGINLADIDTWSAGVFSGAVFISTSHTGIYYSS